MKLDKNTSEDGKGKYALVKLRKVRDPHCHPEVKQAVEVLHRAGVLDYGDSPETDFFVMRLKDEFASEALHAYAHSVALYLSTHDDTPEGGLNEYLYEILDLAAAAGVLSSRLPD